MSNCGVYTHTWDIYVEQSICGLLLQIINWNCSIAFLFCQTKAKYWKTLIIDVQSYGHKCNFY